MPAVFRIPHARTGRHSRPYRSAPASFTVPFMAKRKTDEPPTFEAALEDLETIARDLEEGSLGLDESLRRFEQGVGLLRRCYGLLDAAEQKIAILTGFDGDGKPVLEPFDATATVEQGTAGRRKAAPKPPADSDAAPDSDSRSPAERGLF